MYFLPPIANVFRIYLVGKVEPQLKLFAQTEWKIESNDTLANNEGMKMEIYISNRKTLTMEEYIWTDG